MTDYILGLDPGGASRRGYGWALVERTGWLPSRYAVRYAVPAAYSGNATDAWSALRDAQAKITQKKDKKDKIVAVGIDAPLGYDIGPDRRIDGQIRIAIRGTPNQPMKVNSLFGACLAQGQVAALFIQSNATVWPWCDVKVISESYPQAVSVLGGSRYTLNTSSHSHVSDCDICDALLAALSAWAAYDASLGRPPSNWDNWHTKTTVGGVLLRPEFPIVPCHEYWLPIP